MSKTRVAWALACSFAIPLSACSRAELPPLAFTATKAVKETSDPQAALDTTRLACQEVARKKGIASVTAILLRRSKTAESDYIDCMREQGYDVAQ